MKLRTHSGKWQVASGMKMRRAQAGISRHPSPVTRHSAFTLIELILILALLVIITSLAAPAMANFIRGRAWIPRRAGCSRLMHAAQSRAVSEGMPMVLWVDQKNGAYGISEEMAGKPGSKNSDPKAENLNGGFDTANRGAECRFGHADDIQQSAGDTIFAGRHGGRKQSADGAVGRFRRFHALAAVEQDANGL